MISPIVHSFLILQVLRFFRLLVPFWLMLFAAVRMATAQTLHWDGNGASPGAGTAPAGVWNLTAAAWGNAAGDGAPGVWSNSGLEIASFAAGADATGSYEVTLGAGEPIRLAGLELGEGAVRMVGATAADRLDFGAGAAAFAVGQGAGLTADAAVEGIGLTKSGNGILTLRAGAPSGGYVITGGTLTLGAGVNVTAGALTVGGGAGLAANLVLDGTAVFGLGGNLTYSNVGGPLAASISGGTVTLNGNRSLVIQNGAAAVDLTIDSVLADGSDVSGITKTGGGVLVLTGNNGYTGSTVLPAGSGILRIEGDGGSIAASSAVSIGAAATLSVGASADAVAVNRLGDAAEVRLIGGVQGGATLTYAGANFASQGVDVEQVGGIVAGGSHRNFLTLTPGSGDELVIQAASLTRTDNGVLLLRGSGLGAAAGGADSTRVLLGSVPELVGSVGAGILPWAIGDVSAAGNGSGFLTYDGTVGLRLLNAGEYVTPQAAGAGANVLKSVAGNITLSSSVAVNSWTNTSTGTVSLGTRTVGIESGGMLFTVSGTLNGGVLDLASTRQGIIHLAGGVAVTATINSEIRGERGLILSGTGGGNKTLVLGGANSFTGGLKIYTGIVQLNHAGALNAAGVNDLTVQTGGTLRLNGNNATIGEISGSGSIVNNHATNGAVLTVTGGGSFNGTLNDGAAGTLGLVSSGDSLILGGNNTFTGGTVILNGQLHVNLAGTNPGTAGRLSGTQSLYVGAGAVLQINNGNANSTHADRVNDAAGITLAGASLIYNHAGVGGIAYAETLGAVALAEGASTITTSQGNSAGGSSALTLSGLSRTMGGVLNFTGTNLGLTVRNRVDIPTLSEGFVGGWATVGSEFAKYVEDIDVVTAGNQGSVTAFTAADYVTTAANDGTAPWSAAVHAKPAADQGTVQGMATSKTVGSLNLGNGIDINLGAAAKLNLVSGGLIKQAGTVGTSSSARSQITGGQLTAGGNVSEAELFVRVTGANLTIGSVIVDNPGDGVTAGRVSLVKSGAGTLILTGANQYHGATFIYGGALQVGNGGDGSAPAAGTTGLGATQLGQGSVLSGTGLVRHDLTVSGGELRPGDTTVTAGDRLGTLWVGGDVLFNSGTLSLQITQATVNVAGLADAADAGYAGALAALVSDAALANAITTAKHDHVEVSGTFDWAAGAGQVFVLSQGYVPQAGDVFNLLDWAGVLHAESHDVGTDVELPDLGEGLAWDTSLWSAHGILVVTTPEPGRAMLLGLGMAAALLRRRRRFGKN